jgi:hypothetical protein
LVAGAATLGLPWVAAAAKPAADFTVTPSTPITGVAASYDAVLSSAYRRATVEWDFDGDPGDVSKTEGDGEDSEERDDGDSEERDDGDSEERDDEDSEEGDFDGGPGDVFETQGASVPHVYTTPGEKQANMRVAIEGKVQAVVTKTIDVNPRPVERVAAPSRMSPFPRVRIAGQLLPWGARVRLLAVRAPPGAVVTARCHGEGCPLRALRRHASTQPVRIRGLERHLMAGIRLEILVRQHGLVGKYTRFRIRAGLRPPLRVDRCLLPGRRTPIRCSFG